MPSSVIAIVKLVGTSKNHNEVRRMSLKYFKLTLVFFVRILWNALLTTLISFHIQSQKQSLENVTQTRQRCGTWERFYECILGNVNYTSRQEIFHIEVQHDRFYDDRNVTHLSVSGVANFVPMEILEKFENLRSLTVDSVQLQELDMPFVNCTKLTSFSFRNNNLVDVPRVFDECTKLVVIDLSFNNIVTIDGSSLKILPNLYRFEMNTNPIEEIPDGLFSENKMLGNIDFGNNNFATLQSMKLDEVSSLKILRVGKNPFTATALSYFKSVSIALQELFVARSQIEVIDEGSFAGITTIQKLDLSYNQISYLHPKCFENLTNLAYLDLNNNKIGQIDSRLLANLKSLSELVLRTNQIEDFAAETFVGLKVSRLDISGNKLTRLRMSSFGYMPNILILIISDNKLRSMHYQFFDTFPKLIRIEALNASCINRSYQNFKPSDRRDFFNCFTQTINCKYDKTVHGNSCDIINVDMKPNDEITMIDGNNPLENVEFVRSSNSTLDFIPQVIFDNFGNLSRLELKNVGMRNLKNLENCESLTYLNLDGNEFRRLEGSPFEKCINLREISLNGNEIQKNGSIFSGLKNLEILHIEILEVSFFLNYKMFENTPKLRELFLSIQGSLYLPKNPWIHAQNLQTLKLESSKMIILEEDDFGHLSVLETLSLARNQIKSIHENAFDPLLSLKYLDLSYNNLTSLHDDSFTSLTNLTTLILDHNNLAKLPSALVELQSLTELSIASNKLQTLAHSMKLWSLKVLNLVNNEIASINIKVFESIPKLITLKLFGNSCTQVNFLNVLDYDKDVFPRLSNCFNNFEPCIFTKSKFGYSCKLIMGPDASDGAIRQHFKDHSDEDVKYVQLKFMPLEVDLNLLLARFNFLEKVELWRNSMNGTKSLKNCSNLISFDIRQNKIVNLPENAFSDCHKIKNLVLVNNEIAEISTKAFESLANLELLDLSFNELESLPEGCFSDLTKLRNLRLSHNKIETIESLPHLKYLRVLDLSFNKIGSNPKIGSMYFGAFSNFPSLRELHLNDNQITFIHSEHSKILQNLIYLNLEGNELEILNLSLHPFASLQYLDISNNEIRKIEMDLAAHTQLTSFFAVNNTCISESFDGIENFQDEVLPKLQNCF